jgi:hypothetical protein
MAIGLENNPNNSAITVAYPYGGIKDNTGLGDGTPINKFTNDDIHQTIRKLLELAGITPNGLPDNVTNGFQYVNALDKLYKNYIGIIGNSSNTTFTVDDINKLVVTGGSGVVVNTLPLGADLRDGDCITFLNVGSGTFTVLENTGDTIAYNPGVFNTNDYIRLVYSKLLTTWFAVDYRQAMASTVAFANITLTSNFTAPATFLGNANTAKYRIKNNYVELRGIVQMVSGAGSSNIATLPVGFRPQQTIYLPILTDQTTEVYGIQIRTNGGVWLYLPSGSTAAVTNQLFFLDSIKFTID